MTADEKKVVETAVQIREDFGRRTFEESQKNKLKGLAKDYLGKDEEARNLFIKLIDENTFAEIIKNPDVDFKEALLNKFGGEEEEKQPEQQTAPAPAPEVQTPVQTQTAQTPSEQNSQENKAVANENSADAVSAITTNSAYDEDAKKQEEINKKEAEAEEKSKAKRKKIFKVCAIIVAIVLACGIFSAIGEYLSYNSHSSSSNSSTGNADDDFYNALINGTADESDNSSLEDKVNVVFEKFDDYGVYLRVDGYNELKKRYGEVSIATFGRSVPLKSKNVYSPFDVFYPFPGATTIYAVFFHGEDDILEKEISTAPWNPPVKKGEVSQLDLHVPEYQIDAKKETLYLNNGKLSIENKNNEPTGYLILDVLLLDANSKDSVILGELNIPALKKSSSYSYPYNFISLEPKEPVPQGRQWYLTIAIFEENADGKMYFAGGYSSPTPITW